MSGVVVKVTENKLIVTKEDKKVTVAAPYVKNENNYTARLVILGYYDTLSDLTTTVTSPSEGDSYGVGTEAPYTIYIWNGTEWKDNGTLKGEKGDPTEWFRGTVDPTTEGTDGDLYLNYTTWHVWEKISGTWEDKGTIKGADGAKWGSISGTLANQTDLQAALDEKIDAALVSPAMTGSATLNGTTDNTVQLTGIVTTLFLEVGDVIRIQYSGYDKLHTVESITDDNSIIVNYEHAGNRGDGSLRLADETANVTITRIAKWYNAPVGLGQAWQNLTSSRSANIVYTNSTGRPLQVMARARTANSTANLRVDGVAAASNTSPSGAGIFYFSLVATIPVGAAYEAQTDSTNYWAELR